MLRRPLPDRNRHESDKTVPIQRFSGGEVPDGHDCPVESLPATLRCRLDWTGNVLPTVVVMPLAAIVDRLGGFPDT